MINILQVGLGPLGLLTYQHIREKLSMQTVAALDINVNLLNKDLGLAACEEPNGILIQNNLSEITNLKNIDVAVITTTSSLESILPQIEIIAAAGFPIVTSCEELTFPWLTNPEIAQHIDAKAKQYGVPIISTGVNPGFLMDTLPSMLTGVCKKINKIQVKRIQDAKNRRLPFQKKIGAGLSLKEFENQKLSGKIRHVGLTESIHFLAETVGWQLNGTEDIITPIIATEDMQLGAIHIPKGHAMGVRQIAIGNMNGEEKVKLVFEAAVGLGSSFDEISLLGEPNIVSTIANGVNGDIATCAIILNTIPQLIKSQAGLKTMKNLPIVTFSK